MPVPTVVALVLAVVVVAAAMRAFARDLRERRQAPRALEPSRGSLDVERAGPEARTAPPAPAEARTAPPPPAEPRTEPPPPSEPAPAEVRRSIIPPVLTEAFESDVEVASDPAPADEAAVTPVPPSDPEPVVTPVVAAVAPVAPVVAEVAAVTPVVPVVAAAAPVVAAVAAAAPVVAVVPAADRASIEAEDPERKKARKLARLFVSEIKLYNEKLVAEGRAAGDLYARLKDPIDQSLVAFGRRVPEAVRAEFDYLHDELVRQLAEGDASKLGAQYRRQFRG